MESLRHIDSPHFGGVIFRRTSPQITNEGGLWDEASKMYPHLQAKPNKNELLWRFPSGAKIAFKHLQHEDTVKDWQGAQIPFIVFDELTHFLESQFFYMLSRNRSGVWGGKPYIRATTNPAANSWVKKFLAPWIDKSYHDPAQSGEIRYFVRVKGDCIWGRTKEELLPYLASAEIPEGMKKEELINEDIIKSVAFIKSSVFDNKKLLAIDPGYLANLMSLPEGEKERLLYGNWDASDGMYFSEWVESLHVPDGSEEFPFPDDWDFFLYPDKYSSPDDNWSYFGGVDYGKFAPFSFHLMASNTEGQVVVIDEVYEPGLLPTEQAQKIHEVLERYHLDPKRDCMLYCDPSMFPPQDPKKRIGPYPIESYQKTGLVCIPAVNDRIPGWIRFKEFLHEPGGFSVIKGRAPNLVRTIPMQVPSKRDPEDLETTGEDHACDDVRYSLMSRMMKPRRRNPNPVRVQSRYQGKPVQNRAIPEALR